MIVLSGAVNTIDKLLSSYVYFMCYIFVYRVISAIQLMHFHALRFIPGSHLMGQFLSCIVCNMVCCHCKMIAVVAGPFLMLIKTNMKVCVTLWQ